jgi:hypothetical protein
MMVSQKQVAWSLAGVASAWGVYRLYQAYVSFAKKGLVKRSSSSSFKLGGKDGKRGKKKGAVDAVFLHSLLRLLKIAIPSVRSYEFGLLLLHTFFLASRTASSFFHIFYSHIFSLSGLFSLLLLLLLNGKYASIKLAELDGKLVKAVVERNQTTFRTNLIMWLALAVPSTLITSMIKYLDSQLAVTFRARLMDVLYQKYMESQTYYRVSNLDGRLANVDQCLTEDVSRWHHFLSHSLSLSHSHSLSLSCLHSD